MLFNSANTKALRIRVCLGWFLLSSIYYRVSFNTLRPGQMHELTYRVIIIKEIIILASFFCLFCLFVYLIFLDEMRLHSVSHEYLSNKLATGIILDITSIYSKLVDNDPASCEDIALSEFTNIVWHLPNNRSTNPHRVYMKGTRGCHDLYAVWFMSGRELRSIVMECDVTHEQDGDIHVCDIRCHCACGLRCDYLRLQLQSPPWIKRALSLCHYENLDWILLQQFLIEWRRLKIYPWSHHAKYFHRIDSDADLTIMCQQLNMLPLFTLNLH